MDSRFTPSHRGGSGPPLVCIHGFTDTWRTWELILPSLEREHDVLAVTMLGHAGGPGIDGEVSDQVLVDAVERAMDEAGFGSAHIVGNSLGGFVALQLAARGRAESVVALAPAGGWAEDDESFKDSIDFFTMVQEMSKAAAPQADQLMATPEGRRRATQAITVRYEHIPAELLAHQLRGFADCAAAFPLMEYAAREGWTLDAERIDCPVRVVWGTQDQLLNWPSAAVRFKEDWLPQADWVVLEDVGHCPQLDVPLETSELVLGFTAR